MNLPYASPIKPLRAGLFSRGYEGTVLRQENGDTGLMLTVV